MTIIEPRFSVITAIDGPELLKRVERAGRTCYKSECKITDDSAAEFVRKIMKSGHESVIEHETVSVRVVCDRGVSHEIVRHRIASYSQESTRYCDYGKAGQIQVVVPPGLSDHALLKWHEAMECAERVYNCLREVGVPPQIARSVLPNSLKTEIVMTLNLRSWRNFFRLRCSPAAHPQMRQIAVPLLAEFKRLIPVVFDDLYPVAHQDGGAA